MFTDPISDLLTRIRNAASAHHETVTIPHSKLKEQILKVMQEKGFIREFETIEEGKQKLLEVVLFENRKLTLKRISSPGQRLYTKNVDLKSVKSGLGLTIVSTSQGVMSNLEAKRKHLGGELICEIF